MKRVVFTGIVMGLLMLVLAPVSFNLTGVTLNQAQAAPAVTADDHVCTVLPPLGGLGQGSCKNGEVSIPNNQPGGAIVFYLAQLLKLAGEGVGLVVIMMIVISGFQYITSTADPTRVKAAKNRLQGALIALLLFLTMYAILTFLMPGVF